MHSLRKDYKLHRRDPEPCFIWSAKATDCDCQRDSSISTKRNEMKYRYFKDITSSIHFLTRCPIVLLLRVVLSKNKVFLDRGR